MLVGDLQKVKGEFKIRNFGAKSRKLSTRVLCLESKRDLIIEFIDLINNQSNVEGALERLY
jgi:hypothetical protein